MNPFEIVVNYILDHTKNNKDFNLIQEQDYLTNKYKLDFVYQGREFCVVIKQQDWSDYPNKSVN